MLFFLHVFILFLFLTQERIDVCRFHLCVERVNFTRALHQSCFSLLVMWFLPGSGQSCLRCRILAAVLGKLCKDLGAAGSGQADSQQLAPRPSPEPSGASPVPWLRAGFSSDNILAAHAEAQPRLSSPASAERRGGGSSLFCRKQEVGKSILHFSFLKYSLHRSSFSFFNWLIGISVLKASQQLALPNTCYRWIIWLALTIKGWIFCGC